MVSSLSGLAFFPMIPSGEHACTTAPGEGAPLLLALFHPDCNRRLRNSTGSADLQALKLPEALAGSDPAIMSIALPLPPVGNFTPP